ncbi:hypothetical protein [Scytonema sp. PCC 10023]|uniref:hypothetical protein n=1 Tax=Scytonema sp. PCC 10023 TaxID=1680591 RepID=UPI0039C72D90
MSKTVMRTGESSPVRAASPLGEGGFPNLGNWLSRWGEKYQFAIARTKVQRKSTRY